MRESYYYSLLKSTADKEILDMPIEALGIKASVLEELKKLKSVKRGRYEPILSTVGDLVSYGYSELVSYLSISKPRYDDLREKVYHIEEKLAKLGLKLEGTEFTIGDVRVHELDINNEARNMLEPLKNKIKTLDDVIIHRYDRWLMYTYRNSNALKSMEEALEKYGLRIEGSPNRIDKSKKFPLDKYAQYLSTDYLESKGINVAELGISKRRKTGTAPKVELLNLHEMTLEEIRELELKQAKIMNKHIQTLNEHEIVTIGDLLDAGEQKLRSILGFSTMRILQKKLASYNLKVKGSTVGVENGAIIYGKRGNRSNKALTPDAPEKRDVLALNEEEKKAFMDMKIHEFGFIESITDCFVGSEKYKTIGDLVSTPKDLLKADMTNAGYESLKTALKQYNLKLAKVSKPNHDSLYYDSSKIIPDKNIQNMSEEEKAEFLKTPLKDVGFKDSITIPLSKFETPILTLGDLVNTNTGVLHDHGFAEYPIFAIKQVLSHYGAKLTANRGRYSKKYLNQIEVKSVEKMTGEEKAIFLGQSPKAIGLSDKITNRLAQKGNIHTIGDLVKSTFSYLKNVCGINPGTITQIRTKLGRHGLQISVTSKAKKAENTSSSKTKSESSTKTRSASGAHKIGAKPKDYSYLNVIASEPVEVKIKRPIEDLNFSPAIYRKLKNANYNTIGDLTKSTYSHFVKNVLNNAPSQAVKIRDIVERVGLSLRKNIKTNENDLDKKLNELKQKDQAELLNYDIKELMLREAIEKKFRKNGINIIGDIVKHNKAEINVIMGLSAQHTQQIIERLDRVGLKLAMSSSSKYPRKIQPENVTKENIDEIMVLPIRDLGLRKSICDKFEKKNVYKIKELIALSFTDCKSKFNLNSQQLLELGKELEGFGLSLYKKKERKRRVSGENGASTQANTIGNKELDSEFVLFEDEVKRTDKLDQVTPTTQRVMSSQINTEFSSVLNALGEGLNKKGIWALYDVDNKYFGSCTLELEEIKEYMREYFDKQLERAVRVSATEEVFNLNIQKIEKETNTMQTIIEQKQLELKSRSDSLDKKKVSTASAIRQKIHDRINKYHHKPINTHEDILNEIDWKE